MEVFGHSGGPLVKSQNHSANRPYEIPQGDPTPILEQLSGPDPPRCPSHRNLNYYWR